MLQPFTKNRFVHLIWQVFYNVSIDLIFELAQLIVKMSYVYVNYSESLILSSLQSWIEVLDIYLILKKHPSKKLLVKAGSSNFFILLINQIFLQGM